MSSCVFLSEKLLRFRTRPLDFTRIICQVAAKSVMWLEVCCCLAHFPKHFPVNLTLQSKLTSLESGFWKIVAGLREYLSKFSCSFSDNATTALYVARPENISFTQELLWHKFCSGLLIQLISRISYFSWGTKFVPDKGVHTWNPPKFQDLCRRNFLAWRGLRCSRDAWFTIYPHVDRNLLLSLSPLVGS